MKTMNLAAAKFPVGTIVITAGASRTLTDDDVLGSLVRHMAGDWGDLDECDRKANDAALAYGFRLLSRYVSASSTVFWIITEHDRSVTTILLPEEY